MSFQPGLRVSTMNQLAPSSLRATTIAKAAPTAPEVNHLWPSRIQSSPSRRAPADAPLAASRFPAPAGACFPLSVLAATLCLPRHGLYGR